MRHLHGLGHRRIAVIRGPEELFDSAPRWAGVQRAAAAAGIQLDPRLVFQLPSLADSASGFEGGLDLSLIHIFHGLCRDDIHACNQC